MLHWTLAKVEDGPATSYTYTAASRRELRGGRVSTAFPYAKQTVIKETYISQKRSVRQVTDVWVLI